MQLSAIIGLVLGATTVVAAAAPTIDVPSTLAKRDNTRFGNGFVTNWTSNRSWILKATTSLFLPAVNDPQVAGSALGLWPVQYCTHNQGEWCIVAAAFVAGQMQCGANTSAAAGSKVTFHYVYNARSSSYKQDISINGTVVSSISTPWSQGQKWRTTIECQTSPCGTIDAHQYLDSMVMLVAADSGWLSALYIQGATQDMTTRDGGYKWTADAISIDAYTFS